MNDEQERDNSGQYQPEHPDAAIIAAVEKHEPAGTSEVAEELTIARQSADYRLRSLEKEGELSVKKIGQRSCGQYENKIEGVTLSPVHTILLIRRVTQWYTTDE